MKIEKLMTRDVRSCRPEQSLVVPARIMWEDDCGCVPVVDDEQRVIAMITDRDVCMAAYTQGRELAAIAVHTAMSRGLHACSPTDDLKTVEEVMKREQVRRLPVLDDQRRLVGLVSVNDLVCEAASERPLKKKQVTFDEVGDTLATLSAHRVHRGEELAVSPAAQPF